MHLLLNEYNKIIYKTNDYSLAMKTWNSNSLPFTDEYIYVGAPHTFASRFIKILTANAVSANLSVEFYKGSNTWQSVTNLADETKNGLAPLGKDGFISWDLPKGWIKTQIEGIPELEPTVTAKDGEGNYYIRIGASAELLADIEWLGMIWTNQDYMAVRWPEVIKERFLPTGKTNWYELIEMTTSDVGKDLERSNIIQYEMQAKDIGQLADLTSLKCLINILTPLVSNEKYRNMREDFQMLYNTAKKANIIKIDENNNEEIDQEEKEIPNSFRMVRR